MSANEEAETTGKEDDCIMVVKLRRGTGSGQCRLAKDLRLTEDGHVEILDFKGARHGFHRTMWHEYGEKHIESIVEIYHDGEFAFASEFELLKGRVPGIDPDDLKNRYPDYRWTPDDVDDVGGKSA